MVVNKPKLCILITLILPALLYTGCLSQNDNVKPQNEQKPEEGLKQEPVITCQETALPVLNISHTNIFPGDFLILHIEKLGEDDEVTITTGLHTSPVVFYDFAKGKLTLLPVHYSTPPGDYSLYLSITRSDQLLLEQWERINLKPKDFSTQYLKVAASQNALREPTRQEKDSVLINKAKSTTVGHPLWDGNYIMPLEGRITTEFGLTRYINNVLSGRHSGLDIAAPRGTPIKAANDGIVNLSQSLYVTGNTIIIDHGLSVYSSYCHLDKLLVTNGEKVKKGQIIGEVGSTGFSTGPHLHWTISIGPVFVNPRLFLEEDPLIWIEKASPF